MLNRLIELQRQACVQLSKNNRPWFLEVIAENIPAGRIVAQIKDKTCLTETLHRGWANTVDFYLTTGDAGEYLHLNDDYPCVDIDVIDPEERVILLPELELYVQLPAGSAKLIATSPVKAEAEKPAPKKLEFLDF